MREMVLHHFPLSQRGDGHWLAPHRRCVAPQQPAQRVDGCIGIELPNGLLKPRRRRHAHRHLRWPRSLQSRLSSQQLVTHTLSHLHRLRVLFGASRQRGTCSLRRLSTNSHVSNAAPFAHLPGKRVVVQAHPVILRRQTRVRLHLLDRNCRPTLCFLNAVPTKNIQTLVNSRLRTEEVSWRARGV